MKHYFYAENGKQLGPFTLEELKLKRLKKSTLVWTEGMEKWNSADTVDELKDILISEPPPLPEVESVPFVESIQTKPSMITVTNSEYDLSYSKESEATIAGISLLVISIIIQLIGTINVNIDDGRHILRAIFFIFSLIIRIAITNWVVGIAKRQNRNSTAWGFFAFFLPSIALIVIGQLKKLRLKIELDSSLPVNQQVSILLTKAKQFYQDKRYLDAIEILNKAIELDKHDYECIEVRGFVHYKMENYELSKIDFEELNKNGQYPSVTNYYLGKLAIKDFDREQAVSYWLKSNESNGHQSIVELDLYHNFTGKYFLDRSQISKKLGSQYSLTSYEFQYIGGMPNIDISETTGNLKAQILIYNNGIYIILGKGPNRINLAVAYYEIGDIIYNSDVNNFELALTDKNKLIFSLNHSEDYKLGINDLCRNFKQATGKIATAESHFL